MPLTGMISALGCTHEQLVSSSNWAEIQHVVCFNVQPVLRLEAKVTVLQALIHSTSFFSHVHPDRLVRNNVNLCDHELQLAGDLPGEEGFPHSSTFPSLST